MFTGAGVTAAAFFLSFAFAILEAGVRLGRRPVVFLGGVGVFLATGKGVNDAVNFGLTGVIGFLASDSSLI